MKLSAPIYHLKRRARQMARNEKIGLHAALDRVAQGEGFAAWSLLSSKSGMNTPSKAVLSRLMHGDVLLLGARPGHGKTMLGLQVLIDAAREGRKAVFFTLEATEQETRQRIETLDGQAQSGLEIVTSEDICADYIIAYLSGSPPGSVAVVDYLQILDQQRRKPALSDQMRALRSFARDQGIVLAFITQIDRSFDPENKLVPDIQDIRLPNPVDLGVFTKACFLHNGELRLQTVA